MRVIVVGLHLVDLILAKESVTVGGPIKLISNGVEQSGHPPIPSIKDDAPYRRDPRPKVDRAEQRRQNKAVSARTRR